MLFSHNNKNSYFLYVKQKFLFCLMLNTLKSNTSNANLSYNINHYSLRSDGNKHRCKICRSYICFFTLMRQECVNLLCRSNVIFKRYPVPNHHPLFPVTGKTKWADCISYVMPTKCIFPMCMTGLDLLTMPEK